MWEIESNSYPVYMLRNSNDPLTNEYRSKRNKRISSKRASVGRVFSTSQYHMTNHVKTTTILGTKLKILITSIIINIKQIDPLQERTNNKI
ncbi:MAG: hypothetical protein KO202_04625 [Methanobacteriaceae archaeon]|nr:hypothetical protein [Methanobacteriaceae archaeon]